MINFNAMADKSNSMPTKSRMGAQVQSKSLGITPAIDTGVTGEYVTPRRYQIYGDLIGSKQSMEPIAVISGLGPVTGFNVVTVGTDQLIITGTNVQDVSQSEIAKQHILLGTNKIVDVSTISNVSGKVVNSHVTRDGFLHIDPVQMAFSATGLNASTDLSTISPRYFALVAAHTYVGASATASDVPTIADFRMVELTITNNDTDEPYTVSELTQLGYNQLISILNTAGLNLNENTEVLIGLYLVGAPAGMNDTELGFYQDCGYIIPLIPYEGKWPPVKHWSLNDIINFKIGTTNLGESVIQTINLADRSVTEPKNADNSNSTRTYQNGSVTNIKLAGGITNDKFATGAIDAGITNNSLTWNKVNNNGGISTDAKGLVELTLDGSAWTAANIKAGIAVRRGYTYSSRFFTTGTLGTAKQYRGNPFNWNIWTAQNELYTGFTHMIPCPYISNNDGTIAMAVNYTHDNINGVGVELGFYLTAAQVTALSNVSSSQLYITLTSTTGGYIGNSASYSSGIVVWTKWKDTLISNEVSPCITLSFGFTAEQMQNYGKNFALPFTLGYQTDMPTSGTRQ